MSYYADDAVFIDWSFALVVDPSGDHAVLLVIELANLQLLDMQYYDRLLDELVEKASLDLTRRSSKRIMSVSSGTNARKVAELRIETDSVVEATKLHEFHRRVVHRPCLQQRCRKATTEGPGRIALGETRHFGGHLSAGLRADVSQARDIVGDNHRRPLRG